MNYREIAIQWPIGRRIKLDDHTYSAVVFLSNIIKQHDFLLRMIHNGLGNQGQDPNEPPDSPEQHKERQMLAEKVFANCEKEHPFETTVCKLMTGGAPSIFGSLQVKSSVDFLVNLEWAFIYAHLAKVFGLTASNWDKLTFTFVPSSDYRSIVVTGHNFTQEEVCTEAEIPDYIPQEFFDLLDDDEGEWPC